jgi:hypothetical protein
MTVTERSTRRPNGRNWAGRQLFAVFALLTAYGLLCGISTSSWAEGARFGVRGGYADLDGHLFEGSEALGDLKLYGVQAIFPIVSGFAIEVSGEGVSEELVFSIDGAQQALDAEWNDIALYTTGRLQLLPPGVFGLYAGAGVGVHFTDIEAADLSGLTEEIRKDVTERINEERSDFEWNAVAGASLGLGRLVEVFGEGRYRDVTGDFGREGYALYAGLNLRLP